MEQFPRLRPATAQDFEFAWKTYSEAVKALIVPYLQRTWVDDEEKTRFRTIWTIEKSAIILLDQKLVGWLAFDEAGDEIVIENAYIVREFQRNGIGSNIFAQLFERWKPMGKSVSLSILKNASHRPFFERLGFKQFGETDITVCFRRSAETSHRP